MAAKERIPECIEVLVGAVVWWVPIEQFADEIVGVVSVYISV